MRDDENEQFDEPSRSQRRRDALGVLELAEKLVAMTASQLKRVPLEESILDAVKDAQRITSHIAHKRQVHFLAKKLRKIEDLDPIRAVVDQPIEERRKETAELHLIEDWRKRLIEEGDDALNQLVAQFPAADRHHLRQLVRQAHLEIKTSRAPSAQRSLFQVVKGLVKGQGSDIAARSVIVE